MKSVSNLGGVYNTIKANLVEKAKKLDSLGSRTDNASVVIPEATFKSKKDVLGSSKRQ